MDQGTAHPSYAKNYVFKFSCISSYAADLFYNTELYDRQANDKGTMYKRLIFGLVLKREIILQTLLKKKHCVMNVLKQTSCVCVSTHI